MLARLLNASPNIQRAAALGALAAMLLLALWTAFTLAGIIADQRTALFDIRERAGRLKQLASMDLSTPSEADSVETKAAELFMNAPSLVIARAELQQRLNAIAVANNTVVASAGNLPDLKENETTLIGLRIDFSGPYDDVSKTVLAIETSMPPLIVRELNVNVAGVEQPDRPPELSAQLRVYGAVRFTAAAAPEAAKPQ